MRTSSVLKFSTEVNNLVGQVDSLKDILRKVLKSTPNYETRMREFDVYDAWPRIVGEKIAKHCWPVRIFEGGVLLIAAENSAWLQSLRFLEAQILSKYEKEFKEKRVKQLRYKLSSSQQILDE